MKVDEGLSRRKLTHWLLHRFWREPLVEPHEQHRIRHWYRRVAARAKQDARRRADRASAFLAQGAVAAEPQGVAEAPAAAAAPRPARFKLSRAPEEADAPPPRQINRCWGCGSLFSGLSSCTCFNTSSKSGDSNSCVEIQFRAPHAIDAIFSP